MWKWWSENRGPSAGTRSDKHVAISCTDTIRISGREIWMVMASTVRAVGALDLKQLALVKADARRKHSGFMHSRSQPQGASAWFIESNYRPSVGSPLRRLALQLYNWCRIHSGADLGFPKLSKIDMIFIAHKIRGEKHIKVIFKLMINWYLD